MSKLSLHSGGSELSGGSAPALLSNQRRSSISLVQMELARVGKKKGSAAGQEAAGGGSAFSKARDAVLVDDEHARDFQGDLERLVEDTEGTKADLSAVVKQDRLGEFDAMIRRRNMIHLFLALLSIITFMAEVWLAYDRKLCWSNPDEVAAVFRADPFWKVCMQQNIKTYACKAIMSLSTLALLGFLVDYYRIQIKNEKNARWFIHDSMTWRNHWLLMFTIEAIIILPHPYPTGPPWDYANHPRPYDDKFGVFMFLRSYLILRVLRDNSRLYKRRFIMLNDRALKKIGAIDFNWHFIVKLLFLDHMWSFVWLGLIYVWFVMSYTIWIYEREHNYNFNLVTAVWMTCITMATVGYGDVVPTATNSKICAGVAAAGGIILASLLVFAVMTSLERSPQDVRAMNLLTQRAVKTRVKNLAVRYIQMWWWQYRAHHMANHTTRTPMNPNVGRPSVSARAFNQRNNYMKAKLRECRRIFSLSIDLEAMVTDRLAFKLDTITDVVATALAVRLGIDPIFHAGRGDKTPASLIEISGKAGVAYEDARRIRSKAEAAHKILVDGSTGLF